MIITQHALLTRCLPTITLSITITITQLIYEDDYIGIVNKPGGIEDYPNPNPNPNRSIIGGIECYSAGNGGHGKLTLKSALPYALKPPSFGIKEAYRLPRAMHRLDKLTSGIFIVAKTRC